MKTSGWLKDVCSESGMDGGGGRRTGETVDAFLVVKALSEITQVWKKNVFYSSLKCLFHHSQNKHIQTICVGRIQSMSR